MIDKYQQFGRGVSLTISKGKFKNSELTLVHLYEQVGTLYMVLVYHLNN